MNNNKLIIDIYGDNLEWTEWTEALISAYCRGAFGMLSEPESHYEVLPGCATTITMNVAGTHRRMIYDASLTEALKVGVRLDIFFTVNGWPKDAIQIGAHGDTYNFDIRGETSHLRTN